MSSRPPHLLAPDIFIPAPGPDSRYRPMLHGAATNRLTQISSRRHIPLVDPITGLATIVSRGLTVSIENYQKLGGVGLKVSTHKLLDLCSMALAAQNDYRGSSDEPNPVVVITLDEYMSHFGIPLTKPSRDRARARIKEDLEVLYNISIAWRETRDGQETNYKTRVIAARGIQNNQIIVEFTQSMARYLTHAYLMSYPKALLKIDERVSSAYYLGKKLAFHHGLLANRRRGTHNVISVKKLLEGTPDIPDHQEVAKSDRHFERRIMGAFEKAMNSLCEVISFWNYCQKGGQDLTDEQNDNFNYLLFMECSIKFQLCAAYENSAETD